jgi:ribulose-phosphate 3-epimerase
MAVICPTITATGPHEYRRQMEQVEPFAQRVHIDLMDGQFAPTKSPGLDQVWWSPKLQADIHLMYQRPLEQLSALIKLRPHLVVIHAEAEGDHTHFADSLHKVGIRAGLALLQDTSVDSTREIIQKFDHVLVFSGKLGYHGGAANLALLDKVKQVRELHPQAEISWDGGINNQNARQLIEAGVDVLDIGSYITNAKEPTLAYQVMQTVLTDQLK